MAYTEDKAFELIISAHSRGRLGHAFIFSGVKEICESLAVRVVNHINREPEKVAAEGGGDDAFDLFGEVVAAAEPVPVKEAVNVGELEGNLVRVVRPHSKSRIIKVKHMRDLEKSMYQAAKADKWKVGIIADADRMNIQATNAFLKTLEEPPNGCLLLLITTKPERLLATILSRCVNLALMSENDMRVPLEGEAELIHSLLRAGKQGFSTVSRALTIKSVFASLLATRKAAIAKECNFSLKEEQDHYKNATDGEWLKEREKYYDALTASEYLLERTKFIDLLILWLGDLVRLKSGAPKLEFKKHKDAMQLVADKEDLESLLTRMEAIEELRSMSETNVSEALALEVSFMKAFG